MQPSVLSGMENEHQPKYSDALKLSSKEIINQEAKAGMIHSTSV